MQLQPGAATHRSGSGSFRKSSKNDENGWLSSQHEILHLQSIPEDRVHRATRQPSQRKFACFPGLCATGMVAGTTLHSQGSCTDRDNESGGQASSVVIPVSAPRAPTVKSHALSLPRGIHEPSTYTPVSYTHLTLPTTPYV